MQQRTESGVFAHSVGNIAAGRSERFHCSETQISCDVIKDGVHPLPLFERQQQNTHAKEAKSQSHLHPRVRAHMGERSMGVLFHIVHLLRRRQGSSLPHIEDLQGPPGGASEGPHRPRGALPAVHGLGGIRRKRSGSYQQRRDGGRRTCSQGIEGA